VIPSGATAGSARPNPIGGGVTRRVAPARARASRHARARAVIVTADDFGASPEANAGILRAHRDGILTATSLMVAGAACGEAVEIARDCPNLDVGLHLVVCMGASVLGAARLRGIVDGAGRFGDNPVACGMRYFFSRRARTLLRDEIRAQIEAHLSMIGRLNHIDGHLNFHVHPAIADILVEFCVEYRVPAMRVPREPVFTTLGLARDHLSRKLVEALIFRALSRRTRRRLAAHGIRTTDWLFGLHQTGNMSADYLLGVIRRLPPGVTELYFHPAWDIGGASPSAAARHEVELLTSAAVRAALEGAGARLTNFAELVRS
jgi:hopanoid biosynthesis associated protein HpnK